ncbi:cell division protein FtsW [Lysobacter arseniciresistens ZS79]|uniref:Probable peptidoglycan glycosyltransferase FtsW n=1 Tax=Lysobacter arseniciresistens ZS79 TaxID=913325 RepID=A0A0A0F2H7_9GAMM|nr:putative lipid II flippase FtsW [Lysobacter arseniciresistens]KGM56548.1 cell division protein FtsW [Lysobacter arseniciresistens ZS79]
MTESARQATRLDAISGHYDRWLLGVVCALACLGVVMVGSSSISIALDYGVGPFHYLVRHVAFLAVGVGLAAWLMRTELKTVEHYNHWLLLACVALLLAVFIPGLGTEVNGARRWINLGVSSFQAVEAVKLLYIIWLASYLKRYSEEVTATWKAMLKPLGVALLLVVLLVLQPDFGSLSLILAITGGMLVLGGVNMPRMFGPVLVGLPLLAVVAIAEPYRVRRLTSFLDPWADPFNSGYQLTNALMAVGRGEWFGVGLGGSVQKLSYLPEAHTDFILAVIAEELGFVGVCTVIALYAVLVGRALWIGLKCVEMRRHFAGYCAFGIALWIGLQSFVSIGVNLGLLPTKGLTLPLISSGGSSVLMTCAALGVLLRVSYELDRAQRQVARLRGEAMQPSAGVPATAQPLPAVARGGNAAKPAATAPVTAARGTSRLRQRIEPVIGRTGA